MRSPGLEIVATSAANHGGAPPECFRCRPVSRCTVIHAPLPTWMFVSVLHDVEWLHCCSGAFAWRLSLSSHGVFHPASVCACWYVAHCAITQVHLLLPLLHSGPMSADHLAAPRSPLDVLEDEILTSILLAAAGSESQQQHEQQQYLYGIFSLVCKRFHHLASSSCSSLLVPPKAADQPSPPFASWLSRHGSRLKALTIPANLLVAVAAQQPPVLPVLSNLRSLSAPYNRILC